MAKLEVVRRSIRHPGTLNITLGFGAIYVLTEDTSTWRIQGFLAAARAANLKLYVPVQRQLPLQEIYRKLRTTKLEENIAVARLKLNYINFLEEFLHSGHGTVLFIEDDADFDLRIRYQVETLSLVIWEHFSRKRDENTSVHAAAQAYPYGQDIWDVTWLRHYGIEFTANAKVVAYTDESALPKTRLRSNFNEYYGSMRSQYVTPGPQQQRAILGVAPIVTSAQAGEQVSPTTEISKSIRRFRQLCDNMITLSQTICHTYNVLPVSVGEGSNVSSRPQIERTPYFWTPTQPTEPEVEQFYGDNA
ncbi:glycosyltransferase family 25 protein [Dothistroma septosporum NZE10]|uniref:Glycosyltransferase family 25 protein n=1 Tax=Dothistroma septosporum (strain NZE10 / CBS 128990) TaxID=675120 RepID=M2YNM6_DOTSN|nr:glycosyltransferase family 25 protein [Dothistroma septosporum NZE10]